MWDDRIAQSRDEGSDGGGAYLADARADRDPVGIDPAATPLYLAVTHRTPLYSPDEPECEHLDCIRVLIEAGAIADWADSEGGTPLMAAAAWPWPPVIQLLLTAGADPNRRHKMSGWTPLMFVLYPLPSWPVDGVYHSRAYPRLSGCADPTVQAKGVRLLLDAGADPTARNVHGRTVSSMIRPRDGTQQAAAALIVAAAADWSEAAPGTLGEPNS